MLLQVGLLVAVLGVGEAVAADLDRDLERVNPEYCYRYYSNTELYRTCLENRVERGRRLEKRYLEEARRADEERARLRRDIDRRLQNLRLKAAEAELKRILPMPIWRQREEMRKMSPEIRELVSKRLGVQP